MATWTITGKWTGELLVKIDGDEWKQAKKEARERLESRNQPTEDDDVVNAAINQSLETLFERVIAEFGLVPASKPEIEMAARTPGSVTIKFTFAVRPEFQIGDLSALKMPDLNVQVTKEDIEAEIDGFKRQAGSLQPADKAAEMGDTANIDFRGVVENDFNGKLIREAFEGGTDTGFDLELGSGAFIPGFEEQLVGHKAGEEFDLHVTFPENYHDPSLAGRPVIFEIKINQIYELKVPSNEAEFIRELGLEGVETMEDFRDVVNEKLKETRTEKARVEAEEQFMDQLIKLVPFDAPDGMVQMEVDSVVAGIKDQLEGYNIEFKDYLKTVGMKESQFMEEQWKSAERNIRIRLILEKIASERNIRPTAEQIDDEYVNMAAPYNVPVEDIKASVAESDISYQLSLKLALEYLKNLNK